MNPQLRAIVWAQWRSLRNLYPRVNPLAVAFTTLTSVVWYGGLLVVAVIVARFCGAADVQSLSRYLPIGLLVGFLFWQIVPLVLASTGATLDVRKLLVYPVPHRQLFAIEVLLRVTVGIDVLLVLGGVFTGILFNPKVPGWAPLWLLPFVVFNLTLSAGIRDLLARLFARKGFRQVAIFVLITLTALPQLLVATGVPPRVVQFFRSISQDIWPWTPVARLASGHFSLTDVFLVLGWTAAGYLFGRWQFETGLRFDREAAEATPSKPRRSESVWEMVFRLPSALFRDPLGGLIEKELRFLSRAPRFRLLFFMGFSFGLLIWAPLAFGNRTSAGLISQNFLTFVSIYSLMLLGQVLFYDSFGFDRGAARLYLLVPVRFQTVLFAKNIVAAIFVLVEILAIISVCLALRLPVPAGQIPESVCVTAILSIYLLGVGNMLSTYYPAPVDPAQSWRQQGGRVQSLLATFLLYPLVSIPVSLAYFARWALESTIAFYGGLAFAAILGGIVYWVALDSAVEVARHRREDFLTALSQQETPIAGG